VITIDVNRCHEEAIEQLPSWVRFDSESRLVSWRCHPETRLAALCYKDPPASLRWRYVVLQPVILLAIGWLTGDRRA
jgi:hypothetical protein